LENKRRCFAALKKHLSLRHNAFSAAVASFCSASYSLLDRCESTASALVDDLEKLKSVPLHSSLLTDSRKSLFDALPHSRLLEFSENFTTQTAELRRKIGDWEAQATQLIVEAQLPDIDLVSIGGNLSSVRKVELGGVLLEEALSRTKRSLSQISHISKMQEAYDKSLLEISRRRRFKARYLSQLDALRQECEAMRSEEDERRRKFHAKYGCHLPANLIAGLTDSVAPVVAGLQGSFDNSLPEVSASGLTASPETSNIFLSSSFAST
jgi:hypothetical protein